MTEHKKQTQKYVMVALDIARIWLSVNRDCLITLSLYEHHKSLYLKPRLFFGGITVQLSCIFSGY